jgi:hypothetical protein
MCTQMDGRAAHARHCVLLGKVGVGIRGKSFQKDGPNRGSRI